MEKQALSHVAGGSAERHNPYVGEFGTISKNYIIRLFYPLT